MDDGVAAALFALLLGAPMILFAGLFAGLTSALAALALVGSLAFTFFAANWIATRQETTNQQTADSDAIPSSEPSRHADADHQRDDVDGSLETLRERYARGELSESAFERKTARLLETETPEDARRTVGDRFGGEDLSADAGGEPTDGESVDRDLEHDPN